MPKHTQSRKRFAEFEITLTQFQGLSGLSQLFLPDNLLRDWRNFVDDLFVTRFLQQDFFESAICESYIPKKPTSTLTMNSPNGLFDVIAHIEGTRSQPIERPDGKTEFIYKFTYHVSNPKNAGTKTLSFNIAVEGPNSARYLYRTYLPVKEGERFTRGIITAKESNMQRGPVVKVSQNTYNKVCIQFANEITLPKDPLSTSEDKVREICNQITSYSGPATDFDEVSSAAAAGTPAPAPDFTEGEI